MARWMGWGQGWGQVSQGRRWRPQESLENISFSNNENEKFKNELIGLIKSGIKEKDIVYYDKHAGHGVQYKDILYQVIRSGDVVLID